jgi:hypothetical protein
MPSATILSFAGAAAFYVFLLALARFKHDPREPKAIVGTIPFISPLIGMITQKGLYYIRLRYVSLCSMPAVEIPLFIHLPCDIV